MITVKEYQYVECRLFGHAWKAVLGRKDPTFGTPLDLTCIRCAMHRRDIISPFNGQLLARYYRQPTGYRLPEYVPRDTWRAEFYRRFTKRTHRKQA